MEKKRGTISNKKLSINSGQTLNRFIPLKTITKRQTTATMQKQMQGGEDVIPRT